MSETIHLAHMPAELVVYATLYRDVENTVFLKEQLLTGNTDFEYAFIDASMVISRKHALSAAFRAMNDYLHDRLKSRNVHAEIVFALSPNNNIGEAFRRFGISDDTRALLVLKVATRPDITPDGVQKHLDEVVKGERIAFDDENLSNISDLSRIRKVYKLSAPAATGKKAVNGIAGADVGPKGINELEVQIMGLMALRGAT